MTEKNDHVLQTLVERVVSTDDSRVGLVARIGAATPLVVIGVQHLTGAAPLLPIIEGTPLPFPELNAAIGPVVQVVGGALLAVGLFARVGALMGIGAMAVALFSHATFAPYVPVGAAEAFTWANEPPIALPIAVLALSGVVLVRGAGRRSLDHGVGGRRTLALTIALFSLVLVPGLAVGEIAEPQAARAHYDLDGGLAIDGYDPVAYFTEGRATRGDAQYEVRFQGATYRFASAANRDAFDADPDRYRPAYGGWCAYAMSSGGQTSPDPTNFIIDDDGRLFLFYKNFLVDTKDRWEAGDPEALENDADRNWAGILDA
ncbi:MAG: YHS domain-containing (seleno)protein [Myxococcota bacterium]